MRYLLVACGVAVIAFSTSGQATAQDKLFAVSGQGRGSQADARQGAQITKLESENADRKAETTQNASDIADHETRITNNENELATIQPHAKQAQQSCATGELIQWDGGSYSCVSEDDPSVGPHALTTTVPPDCHDVNAKLLWNASTQQWHCKQDMNDGTGDGWDGFETDPQVGTLNSGRLCRSDGSAVQCDSGAPSVIGGGGINVSGNVQVGGTVAGTDAVFTSTVAGAEPTASNHLTTKNYVDTVVGDATSGQLSGQRLYLGNMANMHDTRNRQLEIGGSAGSYSINVQDGTGRVNMRWNAMGGTSPTYQTSSEQAWELDMDGIGGAGLSVRRAAPGSAGSTITWDTIFQVGPGGMSFDGSGDVSMGNNAITDVSNPSANSDAATKGYVDSAVSGAGDNLGDHTATQNLNMNGNVIHSMADPTGPGQAATKSYVDNAVSSVPGDNLGDHTATGNLNMSGNKIRNMADPTAGPHAATKSYVDNAISSAPGDNLGDHTATQNLNMNGNVIHSMADPTGPGQAATKSYVDSAVSSAPGDNLGNHTATGNLNMNGNKIRNLADPTAGPHAATKSYVDSAVSSVPGDNLGDHTATQNLNMGGNKIRNLADPTANAQAATKGYVDSAIPSCSWEGSQNMGGCGGSCGSVTVPVGNCSGGVFTGFTTTSINCGTCK